MGYKIEYFEKKVITTFTKTIQENEITNAFLEIVDTINIKKISSIVFDCSKSINYSIPADYMARVKVVTGFSTSWNSKMNIIFIATNSEIRHMVNGFMNHDEDLKWKYYLCSNMNEAKEILND